MASTAQAHARRLALDDLPREVLERALSFLPPRDLASLNATARLFHAAPPGGCSPVERALRERARARGHERTLPASLPSGVRTCTEELLLRERVLQLVSAHVSSVSAGFGVSAFVDAEGGLHTCGEEEVRDGDPMQAAEYRTHAAVGHVGWPQVRVPTRVTSLGAVRVAAVAAGSSYLLALSEAGTVYGCGQNRSGQLGVGHDEVRRAFVPLVALADVVVVSICAGRDHSLALSAAGRAYSWGYNSYGLLGHGDEKDRWEPTRIEALDGVRVGGVAAGAQHTLLLSVGGAVYSCGAGYCGVLGHGDQQQHTHTPRRIDALSGVRAVHLSSGAMHSLVVDSAGAVYSFGLGWDGRLGHGDTRGELTPRRIDALAGVHIVRACAGAGSSAVLGADGSVHTFGDNRYGQLGLGLGELGHLVPARVSALAQARVVHCAMGEFHSLFVRADGSVYACGQRSAALGLGMSMAEQVEHADEPTQRIATPTCVGAAWRACVC